MNTNTTAQLVEKFRVSDTDSGSFRSYAHGCTGSHATVEATKRLMASYNPKHPLGLVNKRLGLSNEVVEIHVCDHHFNGNKTHHVLSLKVVHSYTDGREYMVEYNNSLSCEFEPLHIAATIGHWIGSHENYGTVAFLQPKKFAFLQPKK